jgi:hypothetical protein
VTSRDPRRDPQLQRVMADAGLGAPVPDDRLRRLGERIVAAAGPMLREREFAQRTIWEYAVGWSSMLLPLGTLAAAAAAVCLFVVSAQRAPAPARLSSTRVALLGAATNRLSSQNLLDLLVSGDRAAAAPPDVPVR